MVAIEIDPYLVEHLRRRFASEPRLEIVQANVLEVDLAQWGCGVLAGNLPYYITSPILEKAATLPALRAVFLIQKEVAERLVAQPGESEYGFLTVHLGLFADVRLCFEVKPGAFHPPPKVDSAVVTLEPRRRDLGIRDTAAFLKFASHCFRYKRKTLRNNLAEIYGAVIESWPEARMRAEQTSLAQFAEMYRRLL